jgi:hypothetical protein
MLSSTGGQEGEGEMSTSDAWRYRELAGALLVDTFGRFLLQLRDDVAGIVHPGKDGLFGGHREGDGNPADALVITQGSLLVVKPKEVIEMVSKLTPSARFTGLKAEGLT